MDIHDYIAGTVALINNEIKVVCNNPDMMNEKVDVGCRLEFGEPVMVGNKTDFTRKEEIL